MNSMFFLRVLAPSWALYFSNGSVSGGFDLGPGVGDPFGGVFVGAGGKEVAGVVPGLFLWFWGGGEETFSFEINGEMVEPAFDSCEIDGLRPSA